MDISSVANSLSGLGIFVVILARQLQPRAIKTDSAAKLIVILGGIGLVELYQATYEKGYKIGAITIALTVASLLVAAIFGAIRAFSIKVWRDSSGVAFMQGSLLTLVLWIISLGIHLAFEAAIGHSTRLSGGISQETILLYLAVSLGTQREIARFRASQIRQTNR